MENRIYVGKTLTSEELADKFLEQQRERHKNPEEYRGLSFNHKELDRKTGGARSGDLIGIAGMHKAGKSIVSEAMALNFARQLIIRDKNEWVLFVSLEMQHMKLASRAISNLAEVDSNKFRDYTLEEQDWPKVVLGVADLKELPIFWNVNCSTIEGVQEVIIQLEEEYGIKIRVVIIDYFQLMDSTVGEKEWERLADISKKSKQLAMRGERTVILLTQQTTETLHNAKKAKQRGSVAGGRNLERDLDLFLVILPIEEEGVELTHLREVWVALARDAEMGYGVRAFFSGKYCRFGEIMEDDIPSIEPNKELEAAWLNW